MRRFWGVLLALAVTTSAQAADRPNLIVMMTDDQRFDAMSCAGNAVLKTPNMDRIANEGVRFRNMFVTNSLCAPSRATLMTGLYSHSHGVRDNTAKRPDVPPSIPFVSDLLRAAGYEVAFCGKSHAKSAFRDRTWDYYFGFKDQGNYLKPMIAEGTGGKDTLYDGWMDDVVTDHALAWLKKKRDKPFCLFLFFKSPHRSWNPSPRHKDDFAGVTIPKPALWDADRNAKPSAFARADNVIGSPNHKDVPDLDTFLKDYYRCLAGVDDNVGKVFGALKETNKLDDTFMMYTSDNGFFAGEWRAFDKRFMHEPSIRVPMLVRYPRAAKAGSLCDRMVLNVDIAPTLLDVAGVPVPKEMHGRSMVPLLKDPKAEGRKDWLYEYYEYPGPHSVRKNRGVRTERYKYIHYYEEPQEYELYDLEKDPEERTNLYGKKGYEELADTLRKRLQELRKETGDGG
jgi:arylsulfatase A-like enzyme